LTIESRAHKIIKPHTNHARRVVSFELKTSALIKAFTVNSALYPDQGALDEFIAATEHEQSFDWRNVLGYGVADSTRATYCDDFTMTLFFDGAMSRNTVAFFEIPVPTALADTPRHEKVLTVTIVYHPDVHIRKLNDYVGTALKWRVFRGDTSKDDVMAVMSSEVDNDDARELRAVHGIQRRSKGCIQHDLFVWLDHHVEYSAYNYTLAVTSFERWNRANPAPVKFAVVARLEERSRTVPIYNWIEAQIASLVEARVTVHT
jgi:hypothetical protein